MRWSSNLAVALAAVTIGGGVVASAALADSEIVPVPTTRPTVPPRTTVAAPTTTRPRPTTTAPPSTTEPGQPTRLRRRRPNRRRRPRRTSAGHDATPRRRRGRRSACADPPCQDEAVDDYYATAMDEVLVVGYDAGLNANDITPCGSYSIEDLSDPAHGTVVDIPNSFGGFEYTPDAGFTGADSFTYTLYEGQQVIDQATAHITVTDSCSAIAFPDFCVTITNKPVSESAPGFLGNDVVEDCGFVTAILSIRARQRLVRRRRRGRRIRVHPGSRVRRRRHVHVRDPRRRCGVAGHQRRDHQRGGSAVHRRRRRLLDHRRHAAGGRTLRESSPTIPRARIRSVCWSAQPPVAGSVTPAARRFIRVRARSRLRRSGQLHVRPRHRRHRLRPRVTRSRWPPPPS